jgi:hypothetical protein
MLDWAAPDIRTEPRITALLAGSFSASERAEVLGFLDAGELGLALDTLSWIIIDEAKPVSPAVLREIDSLAAAMDMTGEPFLAALHAAAVPPA